MGGGAGAAGTGRVEEVVDMEMEHHRGWGYMEEVCQTLFCVMSTVYY